MVDVSDSQPSFIGGNGTAENPYRISNVTELQWMGNLSNLDKHFVLVNDIDASSTSSWNDGAGFVPIGTRANRFIGSLDGKGYNITGLFINNIGTDYQGLFGWIGTGGVLNNINLIDNDVTGCDYVGGLVGSNSGTLTNCSATGNVSGSWYVGGLVGKNYEGTVTNCSATGNTSGTGYYGNVGGLVGYNYQGSVTNCYSTGVTIGNMFVGGLLGWNHEGTVTNCYSTGTTSGSWNVGGLVGTNNGAVTNCSAAGTTSGTYYVGGLVGVNSGNVTNCYSTGTMSGSWYVGGLVCVNSGNVTNSHYNINASLIKNGHYVTRWGLFGDQFQDWYSNDLSLNISDYSSTLVPDGSYYNISGLQGLMDLLGFADNSNYRFHLTSDIDLSSIPSFHIPYFASKDFDGGGHTISNLQLNQSFISNLGMFGEIKTGSNVSNLRLMNIKIVGSDHVGGLVGRNGGTLTNSSAAGTTSGSRYVGGLVGYNYQGSVTNCYATGTVSGDGDVGGLVGSNYGGIVTNCYATGTTSSGIGNYVGGLVGSNYQGAVTNCYATGTTSSGYGNYVGGLVGWNYEGNVTNSSATGNTSGYRYVGGLVGWNYEGNVTNSSATGNTRGRREYVGGLVGYNMQGTVTNCYSTGTTTSGTSCVGGLVGYNRQGTVTNCYSTGTTSGKGFNTGGLVGCNGGALTNCFAAGNISGGSGVGGLVGSNSGAVTNSYAIGNMSGSSGVGGLVGNNYYGAVTDSYTHVSVTRSSGTNIDFGGFVGSNNRGRIIRCYSTGRVTYSGATDPTGKGFAGSVDTSGDYEMTGNFWDTESSGQKSTAGNATGYNTTEMMKKSTFSNVRWDIALVQDHVSEVWYIDEGYDYPRLCWEEYVDRHQPMANAGPDRVVDEGTTVTFDGSGSTDNIGIVNWTWTFFDGESITLYGARTEYLFNDPGIFIVILNVTDATGYWNEDTMNVTVIDITPPVADAGSDRIVDEGSLISFDGSGSSDNVGIVNWTWTFIDISQITLYGARPEYLFKDPGIFIVTLNVTDEAGNWFTDTMTVTVLDITFPVANAGPDQIVDEDTIVVFDGSGSSDNVGIVNWTWTFFDGNQNIYIFGSMPSYIFNEPGIYNVTLNVTDAAGHWTTDTMTVTVNDITRPVADAGSDLVVEVGTTVIFKGRGSYDNVGIVKYIWTFIYGNDLITLYGINPQFKFDLLGIFNVNLYVTDAIGLWNEDKMILTVRDTIRPHADAGSDQRVAVGSTVILSGSLSTDNGIISRYIWTFTYKGEQKSLEGEIIGIKFDDAGVYEIFLSVYDLDDNLGVDRLMITVVDTGIVRGKVLDKDGNPVEGASAEITSSDGIMHSTMTGENGSFSLMIPHGIFEWRISKSGYVPISGTSRVDPMGEVELDLSASPLLKEKGSSPSMIPYLLLAAIFILLIAGILLIAWRRGSVQRSSAEE